MPPSTGIVTFFIGFIISTIIRAPYESKSKLIAVRTSQKDALEIFLLILMTISIILLPFVYTFTRLLSFADHALPAAAFWLGVFLLIAYLWLFYRSHADLGTNWSLSLEIKTNHELVTTGVYKYLRHPMYSAIYLLALAQCFLLANWIAGPACLISFTLMYIFRIGREERMMAEAFGSDYESYSKKTKRLIPYLY